MAGALFGSGALLALLVLVVLPAWRPADRPNPAIIAAIIVTAIVGAGIFFLARSVGRAAICALMVVGTLLIGAGQALLLPNDVASLAAGMLYVWVAIFAALYFSVRIVAAQLALIIAVQLAALLLADMTGWLPQLVITTGTCLVAALAVLVRAGRMRRDLNTDPLTGTMSRRGLEDLFGRIMTEAAQASRPLAVALLDLDGFKDFNDAYGHLAGDQLLVGASAAWHACLRRRDTITRIGGDEFLVLLPDCDPAAAEGIVARMVAATPPGVTCSAGVTTTLGDEPFGDVVSRADAAMYRAKSYGGGQVRGDGAPPVTLGLYEV